MSDFKKFLLAGILKKRFFTEIEVPFDETTSIIDFSSPPFSLISKPSELLESWLETILMCETEAMLERASPLKPIVLRENKSIELRIFEVVCLKKHFFKSSSFIPTPSSTTWIRVFPASFIISLIVLAPLSIEFSRSSFTTEEGL